MAVTHESLPVFDARIPNWPMNQLTHRNCPLCGQARLSAFLRPDQLPVAYCETCHLWYVCRLPPAPVIEQLYQNYWHSLRPSDLSELAAIQMIEHAADRHAGDVRLRRLRALVGDFKGQRLLEVGCGLASFLLAAREEGARIIGQDISPEACRYVREHLGIMVYDRPLPDCKDEIGRVDIVVMNDLIEHLLDPREIIETAHNLLSSGGLLLIWTPNGGTAGQTLESARHWVGFRVDLEHLQYFSIKSVCLLADRIGFDIEHLETLGYPSLDGIDQLPSNTYRPCTPNWRNRMRRVPGLRRMTRGFRAFASAIADHHPLDVRSGTYHLFAILRRR